MPYSPKNLIEIIKKNKDKKVAATKIIETNPKILPIVPKLVTDGQTNISNTNGDLNVNRSILETIYNKTKSNKKDNKNILQLFPDIELAMQILISSILSPKKMTDTQLNYRFNKNLNTDTIVISKILDSIKDYINNNYDLEGKLPTILREALFLSGAYVTAIIPEASVDNVINSDILSAYSKEEFYKKVDNLIDRITKPINIIKPVDNKTISLSDNPTPKHLVEYLASENFIKITDNVNIVKFNNIKKKITKKIISKAVKTNTSISTESLQKLDYLDIFRQKNTTQSSNSLQIVKTKEEASRKSVGKPMIMKLPTESVVPVFVPGNEEDHIGYFVLLDETGKPLNTELSNNDINELGDMLFTGIGSNSSPIQKAYNNLINKHNDSVDLNNLYHMYKDVLELQIFNSIKNSLYGSDVDIANKNDIYFIMFSRALSSQKTNLLFIPKPLVVYYAFNYDETGVGLSLLDNLSILSSLRAILLFSKTMAYAKQAIDVTKVNISLDPNDQDPEKTIEQIQSSVLKLRQNYFPLGINNPLDLVEWIQKAGLQFNYENNPLIPDVKIDFDNVNIQHTIPDSDLEEDLRKQTIIALGLSPETIDNGFSPEFATTVVNNNILLSKRVSLYQKKLTAHINDFISILITNDEDLRNIIRSEILDNINDISNYINDDEKELLTKSKEDFIEYYLDTISEKIEVYLPEPDNTNIENLSNDFDLYRDNLDKVIDSVISEDIFTDEITGEISGKIEFIRNIYKHYLLRKWMSDNNFFPEVLELANINDEELDTMMNVITNHLNSVTKGSLTLMTIMEKFKKASNADIQKLTEE